MVHILRNFLLIISMYCSITTAATELIFPKQALVPGGVALVAFESQQQKTPEVRYLGNRVLVMPSHIKQNSWTAVVGIPITAQPGIQYIEITTATKRFNKPIVIKAKKYPTETIKITDSRKVVPLTQDCTIIAAQYLEIINTYATWQDSPIQSLSLLIPVKGRKSSPFGLTRIMNNIRKDPHSGLDIAAPIGTKVTCPRSGRVINVGNFFYNGNIVFIDHGQGFITSYCHLDSIKVTKGQKIQTGEIIGTVGKTGRVTGPHLHWSVSLNGVRVDPQLFIDG